MTPIDPDVLREIERLDRRLLAVETVPMKLATVEVELQGIKEDVGEVRRDLASFKKEVRDLFERRRVEREEERKEAVKDKRSNRNWTIGTALATAGLVISAVALLLQSFGGSP